MKITSVLKPVLFNLLLISGVFGANAQSLPNVQKESLRAPSNIKIDGKTTEWGDKLQAYNKATDVYYTISNDDVNIYLTVQVKYHDIIDKLLRGGITLTINHTLTKKDNERLVITYPAFEGRGVPDATNMLARKEIDKRNANGADVAVEDINKLLDVNSKSIKVKGIKGIADETISVYNQEGIKAVSQLDKQLIYTYELAIPLKYLNLPNNGADAFSYNIKVNEPSDAPISHAGPPAPPMPMTATAPTDFWGEYTLAKK